MRLWHLGEKKNSLFNEFVIKCISFGYGFIKKTFFLKMKKDNKGFLKFQKFKKSQHFKNWW